MAPSAVEDQGPETIGADGTHLDIVIAVFDAADDEGGAGGVVLAHGRPIVQLLVVR